MKQMTADLVEIKLNSTLKERNLHVEINMLAKFFTNLPQATKHMGLSTASVSISSSFREDCVELYLFHVHIPSAASLETNSIF